MSEEEKRKEMKIPERAKELWEKMRVEEIIERTNWFTLKYSEDKVDLVFDECGEHGYSEAVKRFETQEAVFLVLRGCHVARKLSMITLFLVWIPGQIKGFERAKVCFEIDKVANLIGLDDFVLSQASDKFQIKEEFVINKVKKITKRRLGKIVLDKSVYSIRRQSFLRVMEKEEKKKKADRSMGESFSFKEILTTEKYYVRSMKLFNELYIKPMGRYECCLGVQRSIEPSLNIILSINSPFLKKLEGCYHITEEEKKEEIRREKEINKMIRAVLKEAKEEEKKAAAPPPPPVAVADSTTPPTNQPENPTEATSTVPTDGTQESTTTTPPIPENNQLATSEEKKEEENKPVSNPIEQPHPQQSELPQQQPEKKAVQEEEEEEETEGEGLEGGVFIPGVNDIGKMVNVLIEHSHVFKLYLPYIKTYNSVLERVRKILKPVEKRPPSFSISSSGGGGAEAGGAATTGGGSTSVIETPTERLERSKEKFQTYVKKVQKALESVEERTTNIQGFMIMPIQRIPRYQLLMRELSKKTPSDDPLYERIQEGLSTVGNIAKYIDSKKNEVEMSEKTIAVAKEFKMNDLMVFPRKMVKFCNCTFWKNKLRSELFVFNDLVLISFIPQGTAGQGGAKKKGKGKSKFERVNFDVDVRCYSNPRDEKSLIIETQRKNHHVYLSTKGSASDMVSTIQHCLQECVGRLNMNSQASERTIFSGYLEKQGGGTFSYSMKKRWHVLSADLKMRYYDRPSGKMKGSYSVIGATVGKGFPESNMNKKQQQFFMNNQEVISPTTTTTTTKTKTEESQKRDSVSKKSKSKGIKFGKFLGGGKKKFRKGAGGLNIGSFSLRYVCWFYISTPKRTYYLVAQTVPLLDSWVKVLNFVGCERLDFLPEKIRKWQEEQMALSTNSGEEGKIQNVGSFKFMRESPIREIHENQQQQQQQQQLPDGNNNVEQPQPPPEGGQMEQPQIQQDTTSVTPVVPITTTSSIENNNNIIPPPSLSSGSVGVGVNNNNNVVGGGESVQNVVPIVVVPTQPSNQEKKDGV